MDCGCSGSTKGPRVEEPEPAEVRVAMDGDLAAFERLVRRYQAHVWRFLRHLLGDAALAEDVTQETFLRLYQRLPTFEGRSRFSTWVFRVARNAGVDALRAARRHDRLLAALPAPPPGPAPEARVEAMAAELSVVGNPSISVSRCRRSRSRPTNRAPVSTAGRPVVTAAIVHLLRDVLNVRIALSVGQEGYRRNPVIPPRRRGTGSRRTRPPTGRPGRGRAGTR